MELVKYSEEVRSQLAEAEKNRFTNPKKVIQIGMHLAEIGREQRDDVLQGMANFCIGDAYYTLADGGQCTRYINHAIHELTRAKEWQKLGECYNLLGILFAHQGNTSQALSSYYSAMELVETYGLDFLGAMVYENYSELCDRSNNEEEAYRKILMAKSYIEKIPSHPRKSYVRAAILIRMIKTLLKLERMEEVKVRIWELEQLLTAEPELKSDEQISLDLQVLDTLWKHANGETEAEEESLKKTIRDFVNCSHRIDFFWTCVELMAYMLKTCRYEQLEFAIEQMEESLKEAAASFPDLQAHISRYKVALLTKLDRQDELFEELKRYYEYENLQKKQANTTIGLYLETQNSLMLSRKTNMMLREQADTDELTGIANRRRLNEVLDETFELMYSSQKSLGVLMMDVDKFKGVNDTYGHAVGDSCLKAVAHAMERFQDVGVFCARYGGDEFFMVFRDKTEEQIKQIGRMINLSLKEYIIDNQLPEFTVSMGACVNTPKNLNKLWDFTSLADKSLYAVKDDGGNGLLIVRNEAQIGMRLIRKVDEINYYEVEKRGRAEA
ncbi:MAG: GGDEF domain-containing protein [Lachnospiraceae bacterium]|nr:GGDEF domain-containing protein [Lachnospiraceae bacterium]